MKKILIIAGILSIISAQAKAQTNNSDQGEKVRVITGKQSATTTIPPATSTTTTTMVQHHTMQHTKGAHKYSAVYHKHTTHHHKAAHSYAKASTHHTVHHKHSLAMHSTGVYTGNRQPATTNTGMTNTNAQMTRKMTPQEVLDSNRKMPITDYPGASNGGWDNGTNGRSGTNSVDGLIDPSGKK